MGGAQSLVVAQSLHFAADPSTRLLLPSSPSLQVPPTEAAMAHASVDTNIDIDGALALIEEVKNMLAKMVATEEPNIGTLKTGYPRIQSLSQDKEQHVHPRATTYAVALDHTSLQMWAPAPPHVPRLRTSPPC
jgi:hypothetical protein